MKEVTTLHEGLSRWVLIRVGDTDTANKWAEQLADKLAANKPLNPGEAAMLASALYLYAANGEAARLWNLGKIPHKSNRLLRDYKLYRRVNDLIAQGKSRKEAIEKVCEEQDIPGVVDDDPEGACFRQWPS